MVQGKIPEQELTAVYDPMVNLILQGSKLITIAEHTLHYLDYRFDDELTSRSLAVWIAQPQE